MRCQLGPGLPRLPPPITLVPFSSQITTSPVSFCHKMSEKPSPLKSPDPFGCQLGSGLPRLRRTTSLSDLLLQQARSTTRLYDQRDEQLAALRARHREPCARSGGAIADRLFLGSWRNRNAPLSCPRGSKSHYRHGAQTRSDRPREK